MKFLSIITPTYNRARKLHRVYESIKSQTLQKIDNEYIFEWIIIDDGSEDNTKELVQKWQRESEFSIIYKYQKNLGKWRALQEGIKLATGELTLIADSDDRFKSETFETFYNIWSSFNGDEKEKCGGIGVLCEYQNGKRVGCYFPIEKKLISTEIPVFKWKNLPLGETWAAIKTKNLKYGFLELPEDVKKEMNNLKFIPESFFWDRITFDLKLYSYPLNKVLRVYYKEEDNTKSHKYSV
jgi:glycosyltransferase involved in cell wall biosynthesis